MLEQRNNYHYSYKQIAGANNFVKQQGVKTKVKYLLQRAAMQVIMFDLVYIV